MAKYSAKQRKLRGQGKHGGPAFIQLFHYVKRSEEYHRLSPLGRAFLIEIIDRYNGINNGMIVLGAREAAYELGCSKSTAARVAIEVDDSKLAMMLTPGAWRGRNATEWRLAWRRCDKTGDLPKRNWVQRKPFVQLLLPPPKKKDPLTNTERQKRFRDRRRRTVTGFEVETIQQEGVQAHDPRISTSELKKSL